MIRARGSSRAIYNHLYQMCSPYILPAPWRHLVADAESRGCPEDPGDTLCQLARRHSEHDLIYAGVVKSGEGTPILSPCLSRPGAPLVFIRQHPTALPIDVLTGAGGLAGQHDPLVLAYDDYHTQKALAATERNLLIACTLEDVVLLRALGLPSAPAKGFEAIDRKRLLKLMDRYGWRKRFRSEPNFHKDWFSARPDPQTGTTTLGPTPSATAHPGSVADPLENAGKLKNMGMPNNIGPATAAPGTAAATKQNPSQDKKTEKARNVTANGPNATMGSFTADMENSSVDIESNEPDATNVPSLTFVGWTLTPLLLDVPVQLIAIQKCLHNLEKHLDIEMDVGLWVPSQTELERIRFKLCFDPMSVALDDIFHDFDDCADFLYYDFSAKSLPPVATTFLEAEKELRAALQFRTKAGSDSERVRRAQEAYSAQLEREIIQPLLRPTDSPLHRNLTLFLMHISRSAHRLGPLIEEKLTRLPVERLLGDAEFLPAHEVAQMSILVRNVIRLTRELRA